MAAELEKLAADIEAKGYNLGGNILTDFAKTLRRLKLIPKSLVSPDRIVTETNDQTFYDKCFS